MWNEKALIKYAGPLFKKVILLIENYIEQGVLIAGERLPSERDLATQLRMNRSTIVHALDVLTEQGVLIRRQGSGTFVNDQKWGLQTHSTINWRLPANFHKKKRSLYQQKIDQILTQNNRVFDLANGDLPIKFIPKLVLPDISSHELVMYEKNSDELQLGLPSLKAKIVDYMWQRFAMSVDVNEILITSGTQQSLFLMTQGLLKPGDAIGIESPSYFYSLPLFQAAGLRLYGIASDHEGITLESLRQVVEKYRIKWLFLNPIFQNPTGSVMSKLRKQAVLDFCRRQCIGIVEDDAYSGLSFDINLDVSPIKKLDNYNQVIYLGSLSKYIGRSIRVGWMIAPRTIIEKLAEIRQHIDSGLSILPQLLAEDYLQNHYFSHQTVLCDALKIRSKWLMSWLNNHVDNKIIYQKPLGGFHLYVYLPVTTTQQETIFLNQLLTQKIIVSQGHHFGDKLGTIRLSYGHFELNLL